jgi:lipopolysaccharide exporter
MTLKEKSVKSVKATGFSTVVITGLSLLQVTFLARLLPASEFGLMNMIYVVLGLLGLLADLGLGSAIVQKRQVTQENLSSFYWLNLLFAVFLWACLLAFSTVVSELYSEPHLSPLLKWAGLVLVLNAVGYQFQMLLEKELAFEQLARIDVSAAAVGTLTAIVLGLLRADVYALLGGMISNAGIRAVTLAFIGYHRWRPQLRFRFRDLQSILSFGLNLLGQRSVNYVTSNADFMLIGSQLGAQSLGYYAFAYNLVNLPSTKINAVISRVFFPVLSAVQDDLPRLKRGYLQMQEVTSVINIPLLCGMAVVAPLAIPLVFGPAWHRSVPVLQVLVVVGLTRSIAGTVGPLLMARGRSDLGLKWSLLIAALQIPCIYLGMRLGGVIGVAIAFASLQCGFLGLNYAILVRTLLGPCLKEYLATIFPYFWMSLLMAIVTSAVLHLLRSLPATALLLVSVAVGMLVYCGLVWQTRRFYIIDLKQWVFSRQVTVK